MRQRKFDLKNHKDVERIQKLHAMYINSPKHDSETIAALAGVSHGVIRKAFHDLELPLKVNKTIKPEQAKALQNELGCPLDYMAAKYRLNPNTLRLWMKRKPVNRNYNAAAGAKWWRGVMESCSYDPNEFYITMRLAPHNLPRHTIPPLFHKYAKPSGVILWQPLFDESPAEYVMEDELKQLRYDTDPDDSLFPEVFIGEGRLCHPVQFTADAMAKQQEMNALDEELAEAKENEDSMDDIDLEALAADLGIDL